MSIWWQTKLYTRRKLRQHVIPCNFNIIFCIYYSHAKIKACSSFLATHGLTLREIWKRFAQPSFSSLKKLQRVLLLLFDIFHHFQNICINIITHIHTFVTKMMRLIHMQYNISSLIYKKFSKIIGFLEREKFFLIWSLMHVLCIVILCM